MNIANEVLLAASVLGLFAAAPVQGASIVLTFKGLQEGEQIQNYYNGGLGQLGSGPGPAFGVTFTSNALVLTDAKHYFGEPTAPEVMLLGNNSVPGGQQIAATMNVTGGFASDLSFYYGSIDLPGIVQIFSGPNGTGPMLASLNLPVTSPGNDAFFTAAPIDIPFAGVADSAVFTGGNQQIVFDNIQLTTVPEPASLMLLAIGVAVVLIWFARQRRPCS
jgi:hypothetical protein